MHSDCLFRIIIMFPSERENQRQLPEFTAGTPSEVPAPTPSSSAAPNTANRKSRIALACKRCKRRKQRCDGARPTCQACDRARQPCTYERVARPQYPGGKALYISALEERIAFLEARLPDHAEDHFDTITEGTHQLPFAAVDKPFPTLKARRESGRESQAGSLSEDVDFDEGTSLVDGVAYLSLCASGTTDTNREPFYLGSSSGATIARVIQSSIYRASGSRPSDLSAASRDRHVPGIPAPSTSNQSVITESSEYTSAFPIQTQARMLFDFFFERIHPRWPLLDRAVYEQVFDKQYFPGALSITERSILHLIYAITARFLAVTRKPCGVDDEAQLTAATEPMEHILKQHNLATVQYLILLGVHGQRSPYGAGAWSQVRYATSVCIEMGLHRKRSSSSSVNTRDAEIRSRAFWSCYCLDRTTSIVLGRAFAIADRDINVELPSVSPEFWSLTHREDFDANMGQWSNVQPFVHIIKHERIQSRIHKTVFRVDRDPIRGTPEERAKLDQKMKLIRAELDDWIKTYPRTPKNDNKSTWMYDPESAYLDARDFYDVQYHKAILFLLTVFLPVLEPTDERFITCARSAASVCNAYKRLSQNKTLTYTMISLHSCFVAGLTLVYCIWRDRKLFSYEVIEATQSCSQILTIFGEKWPGAVKYRDIFDALSQSLFKLTMKPAAAPPPQQQPQSQTRGSPSLQLNIDTAQAFPPPPPTQSPTNILRGAGAPVSSPETTPQTFKPSMSHLVTDAVKEAFMEVDEEAPGGWQGWRMWNEMVTDDSAPAQTTSSSQQQQQQRTGFGAFDGATGVYGIDPVQDAAMQGASGGGGGFLDHGQWSLEGYR
ncbi:hypothetical protein DM02DRAFT_601415 [Periconia macrospinosa]|uniref:Zn(2)-C6 fungal-type domain-containing protein n=1 Tax=Periconia macrospinosa TaxID=97972 RepID=A0A2V1DAD0_9PLEO|nr:hypothetical protein DM02DRAFT_601415 [Periconia macrospinosa]